MFDIVKMQKQHLSKVMQISQKEFSKTSWSRQQFENEMPYSYVCLIENLVVGFLCLQITTDEMTILNIAVCEKFKRQGIATAFLEFAKKMAKQNNLLNIFLEVDKKNEPALNFYQKQGFEFLRIRKAYYKNGADCIEMKLSVK